MTKDISEFSKGSHNFGETSIDSGRGTMTTITSSRSVSQPKPRPFPAFPIKSQITEDEESGLSNSKKYEDKEVYNVFARKGLPPTSSTPQMRHPPSPPVRLRDR